MQEAVDRTAMLEDSLDVVLLSTVIGECVLSKRFANLRKIYVNELLRFLTRFCEAFGNPPVHHITCQQIQTWICSNGWSAGTRATAMNRLSALFSFAERRDYIHRNPITRLERIRLERTPPRILSTAEARQLLELAAMRTPKIFAHLTLGLFAGIRPVELSKLHWRDVDLNRGIVRIDASASKVRCRRIVELEPNSVEWLRTCESREGLITPLAKRRKIRLLAREMGWDEWPKDILRHSCASYLLAKYRDAAMVSDRLGNSPAVLFRHYRELVTKEDCLAFWSIRP